MTDSSRPVDDLLVATILSFVPSAAFLGALVLAGQWFEESASLAGIVTAAPLYLLFVSLPSALPLAAAGRGRLRLAVLATMTAVAVVAAMELVASDDAQAGLAVLLVPMAAFPLAVAVWVGRRLAGRRLPHDEPGSLASTSDRAAALIFDVATVGGGLVVPLTGMIHSGQGVAATVLGIGVATLALAVPVVWRGRTFGQSLFGLAVLDARTGDRIGLGRSIVRSLIVVVEAVMLGSLLPLADLAAVAATGRSLPDRVLRTSVVRTR